MNGSDILGLVITAVMIIILIAGIIKRANSAMLLLISSLAGLIFYTIAAGSVLAENTVGSKWVDMFEYIVNITSVQLSSNVLILGCLLGFVVYCEHTKATTMLCGLIARSLTGMKKTPMVIVVTIMIFESLLKFVIQSNNAQIALVFATLFPVMIMLGVTKETAAAAMAFSAYITWGPANGFTALYSGMGDLGMSVSEYFIKYELWNILVSYGLALVAFVITSKIFDRRDQCAPSTSSIEAIDIDKLGCPKWYAVFPMMPIVLVIIFSKLVIGTIVMSVSAAAIFVWILLFIIEFIRIKDKIVVINDTITFWKGFGDIIWQVGCIIIAASLFSGVMTKIGALSKLFGMVSQGSGNFAVILVMVSLAAGALSILNGNMSGAVFLFGTVTAELSVTMNVPYVAAIRTLMPVTCTATAVSPISNSNLYVASITDVNIMTIVKRVVAPTVVFLVSTFIVTMGIM
jgi:DcuC family C4-dicarboxylate transporter